MSDIQEVLSADAAAVDREAVGLSDGELERLYESMVTTRAVDERARDLHADGDIGLYVASRGLEAVAVGAAFPLQPTDWLFPSHRDVGMFLLRGGSIRAWFDQLFGNVTDLCRGRQLPGHASLPDGRFVSVSGRVGAQIVNAAGCAMAIKARRDGACALASFGAAAAEVAGFHHALGIAARFRAPVVFVCRSVAREPGAEIGAVAPLAERARTYGISAARVDGTDVLAVCRAVQEARHAAVNGGGATLVEAVVGEAALFGEAPAGGGERDDGDPIARLRDYLEHAGLWDAAREETLGTRLRARVDEAVVAARAEVGPDTAALFDDVYADMPWILQEQRERLLGGGGE